MYFIFHSWDIGNAHFVVFSTEVYFYTKYGVELIEEQYKWLEHDLKVYECKPNPYLIFLIGILHTTWIFSEEVTTSYTHTKFWCVTVSAIFFINDARDKIVMLIKTNNKFSCIYRQPTPGRSDHGSSQQVTDQCTAPLKIAMTVTRETAE